jgi:hypothetical protein
VAEAVTPADPPAAEPVDAEGRVVETQPLVARATTPSSTYRRRFGLAYALLAALAVLGFAALGFVLVRATDDDGPPWSAWEPNGGGGLDRADQIAAYVSARYRLDGANQLVAIQADVPSYQNLPAAGYAIREPRVGGEVQIREAEGALQYELCGLGQGCAIAEGEPSAERERLLRREALELALYTFKYVDGVDRVATFLPPRAGAPPTWLLLFERGDYDPQLDVPLEQTLGSTVPLPEQIDPVEVQRIDQLTEPRRYRFEVQTLQGGTPVFVLEPTALQG